MLDQLQRPLRDLRISLIDRCNFRCPYCMPSKTYDHAYQFLKQEEWLSFDEIERVARIFVDLGVKKLRLTGGEPLLRPKIDTLIKRLSVIPGVEDLALTTNGSHLKENALMLKQAGLKRLTVSLDTLNPQIFKELSGGRGDLTEVLAGIDAAAEAGFKRIKINTVLIKGVNDHGILDLISHFKNSGHILRFIEFMDVGNKNAWTMEKVVTTDDILKIVAQEYALTRVAGTEGGETSERYRFQDGHGEIEFISSVTKAFCATCNRLRLSADGKMYTCLFATQGTDLRQLLRQDQQDEPIKDCILRMWQARHDRYSEIRTRNSQINNDPKIEMYHIGG
jgi:cyclic pyranopterin phosphate synthase